MARNAMKLIPLVLILSCFLSACASGPGSALKPPPEEALRSRVDGYMKATVEERWADAYAFLEKGYRKAVSLERYVHAPRKIKTKSYVLESVAFGPGGDAADVAMLLEIEFQGRTFKNAPKSQRWIEEKGEWYLQPDKSSSHPFSESSPQ